MQTVKETVQAVCNIFQAYGLKNVDANHFRLAKHNQSEAVKPISIIMRELLILELFDFEYRLQEIGIMHTDPDGLEIVLLSLKNCPFIVYKNGKPGMNYASSRDLLMIVGQILAEADIFEKYRLLIEKKVRSLQINLENKVTPSNVECTTLKFDSEGNQYLDFQNLKRIIVHQCKQIQTLLKRKEACVSNIDDIVQRLNLKDFTAETLLALSDPTELNQILTNLREVISYLEYETTMHRHQEIFWAWLESIVDEDKKEVKDHIDYGFPDEQIQFPPGQQMIKLIEGTNIRVTKLSESYELFDSISQQFEDEWERVSALLQEDPNSQQKLQQLQLQVHKIMAQNTLRMVSIKSYKDQVFSEKELLYCSANDFIKYELRKSIMSKTEQQPQQNNKDFTRQQNEFQNRIQQIQGYIDHEVKRIKVQLKDLMVFPSK